MFPRMMLILLLSLIVISPISAEDISISLQASAGYGHADGYLQVPRGGSNTSWKRPTLAELNADKPFLFDFLAKVSKDRHSIRMEGNFMKFNGKSELDSQLTSRNFLFEKGEMVRTGTEINVYKFGYEYLLSKNEYFQFGVLLGIAILDFDYQVESDSTICDRKYMHISPNIGAELLYKPIAKLTLVGRTSITIPAYSCPLLYSSGIEVRYNFLKNLEVFSDTEYRKIKYEGGNQGRIHNDINVEVMPTISIGLRFIY